MRLRCDAVDTSKSGIGVVEVEVNCSNLGVPIRQQQLGQDKHRFTFVARSPADHTIVVKFNNEAIPGWLCFYEDDSLWKDGFESNILKITKNSYCIMPMTVEYCTVC